MEENTLTSITLQAWSISDSTITRPLGYFGFSIGSAASRLTSLRHGFITEPDANRMLCVCMCHVIHLRTISCLGNLLSTLLPCWLSFPNFYSFISTYSPFCFFVSFFHMNCRKHDAGWLMQHGMWLGSQLCPLNCLDCKTAAGIVWLAE